MRMELADPLNGTDNTIRRYVGIRDVETGEIISTFADDRKISPHAADLTEELCYVRQL